MIKTIAMSTFYPLSQKEPLTILDVREPEEFFSGHVPTAENFPLSQLGEHSQLLDQAKEYYVICQSGARSARACTFLAAKGYDVINVEGGTSAWPSELV
ncbi:MAG: rhodanese-like domain-containing protein [Enterococcus viikkiensis]